jgi:hypothetical protein
MLDKKHTSRGAKSTPTNPQVRQSTRPPQKLMGLIQVKKSTSSGGTALANVAHPTGTHPAAGGAKNTPKAAKKGKLKHPLLGTTKAVKPNLKWNGVIIKCP